MPATLLYDFNPNADIRQWRTIDDVVMGGRSSGSIQLNGDGNGVFSGIVSLENNGGFSSIRYTPGNFALNGAKKIILTVKGDGKVYQLRIKDDLQRYYSYSYPFETNGDWQQIVINLSDMYPSFRGMRPDAPNFNHNTIAEIAFLIGNKKNEDFQLIIDNIVVQ